jgi:transposase-like protein
MSDTNERKVPSIEAIREEMNKAESLDDFFGKEGIMARLFGEMLTEMMKAELTEQLGYEKYEAKGRNSGNSRNGSYERRVKSSQGEIKVEVPRDRAGEFSPRILKEYQTRTNELEEKIIAMYGRGMTTRDIGEHVAEMYGMDISAEMVSQVTDKVIPLVEEWQNRPLEPVYPVIFLDAIHYSMRKDHQVRKRAVYVVLAVNLTGRKEVLGHWVGDGQEGASFWLSVLTDLNNRGVEDLLIACVDGLPGFKEAIEATFPETIIQRCILHQVRNSLRYVVWKDRKDFANDLKSIYRADTRQLAELALEDLADKWGDKYAAAIRSWQEHWEELSAMFQFSKSLRRLIYTNNNIESYHRQLRKVSKNRGVFPSDMAVRKLLFLAHRNIAKRWSQPLPNWAKILNQLAIHFEGRFEL